MTKQFLIYTLGLFLAMPQFISANEQEKGDQIVRVISSLPGDNPFDDPGHAEPNPNDPNQNLTVSPITDANNQLRNLFEYVPNPNSPSIKFFYQLGAHIIDSAYFDTQCALPTDCDTWFYAYKELSWCAYDTTWMESDTSVYARACDVYSDTITFGIIDWKYNTLISESLYDGWYFGYDEDNIQLYTLSNYSDAYLIGEIFMSSPLIASSQTSSPVFKIDPSFVFSDIFFWDQIGGFYRLFIDFDDGNGPQMINPSTTTYHPKTYNTAGYHVLKTTVRLANDTSVILKSSNSGFIVSSTPAPSGDCADLSHLFPGLRVYQYDPLCRNDNTDDKIIFILAGYNPFSIFKTHTRGAAKLRETYLLEGHREVLRQFGYTFVLVEWEDANRPIEDNATYVMNLLEYYKCNKTGDEQFVLIGESMGALVGRYALTYMESPYYISPNDCCLNTKHNVRLFISNDGPHLGANIPMSIQEFLASINEDSDFMMYVNDFANAILQKNIDAGVVALKGNSVQQMLLYHYSTQYGGSYSAHSDHSDLLDDLDDIGGYPQLCKNVALSNGSLLGYNQQRCYSPSDAGQFRLPNDTLLALDFDLGFRVLGFQLTNKFSTVLRTNPDNVSGQLLKVYISTEYALISMLLGDIKIVANETAHVNISKSGYNLEPYCVSAGGAVWFPTSGYIGETHNMDLGLLGLMLKPNGLSAAGYYVSTSGQLSVGGYVGIPWLGGIIGSLEASTSGLGFCLVPVQSAFCYDPGNWDLDKDYTVLTTTTMFSNTFFDVLSGIPEGDEAYRYNGIHTNYRNEEFENQITQDEYYYHYYQHVNDGPCEQTISRILNREVGDEELFIDNGQLYGAASYSALIQLYVNVPHPYYNFDGQVSTTYKIPGMYCRTNRPFDIYSSGYATFQSLYRPDCQNLLGAYDEYETPFVACCNIRYNEPNPDNDQREQTDRYDVIVYPNPIGLGESLRVTSDMPITMASISDLTGQRVINLPTREENGTIFITIPSTIPTGCYNLCLTNEEGVASTLLFVY